MPEAALIWAETFDGATDDIFEFQDSITEAVAGTVEPQIQRAEIERSRRERPKSLAAYDLYLRATWSGVIAAGEAGGTSAADLLTSALELEPENGTFLGAAVYIHYLRWYMRWVPEPDPRLRDYIERALRHARGDATVIARCANTLVHVMRDEVRALELIRYALELNPHSFLVVYTAGVINLLSGDLDEAEACFKHAMTLSPRDPHLMVPVTGIAHVAMIHGDYLEAVRWAERGLAINAWFRPAYWMLIAAHAFLGNTDEAARYLKALQTMEPSVSLASIRATQPDKHADRTARIFEGLRLAGMPED